jgi:hypothetical protein
VNESRRQSVLPEEAIEGLIRKDGVKDFETLVALLVTLTDLGNTLPSVSISSMVENTESLNADKVSE